MIEKEVASKVVQALNYGDGYNFNFNHSTSLDLQEKLKEWGFQHIVSLPYYSEVTNQIMLGLGAYPDSSSDRIYSELIALHKVMCPNKAGYWIIYLLTGNHFSIQNTKIGYHVDDKQWVLISDKKHGFVEYKEMPLPELIELIKREYSMERM